MQCSQCSCTRLNSSTLLPMQVRRTEEGSLECRALQLSVDHNLADPVHREKYISEHPEDPDIVVEKRGFYKVKGKLSV